MKDVTLITLSHPHAVPGLCEAPASASFETSPRGHQGTLGTERQEAYLHEAPPPPNGSRRHIKARGPHTPAQEAEELASWECPHYGLDVSARAPHLQLRSGARAMHPWGHLQVGAQGTLSP